MNTAKLYIYSRVENITNNYHNSGGLVIITDKTPNEAWQEFLSNNKDDWVFDGDLVKELPEPTQVADVSNTEMGVFIFPDSGCC